MNWLRGGSASAVVVLLLLVACDPQELSPEAIAGRLVLNRTALPLEFVAGRTGYSGNTYNLPHRRFTAPGKVTLMAEDVGVPDGFARDAATEAAIREGEGPGDRWHLVGWWIGGNPVSAGTCWVEVRRNDSGDGVTLAEVLVACATK